MLRYLPVRKVHARQVLDSRGNPTVEAEVTVGEGIVGINGYTGRAMVPDVYKRHEIGMETAAMMMPEKISLGRYSFRYPRIVENRESFI